jgi:hypothetical protein
MFRAVVLASLALAACASQSQTTKQLAESMVAVREAETAGAARIPRAALHLKLAQEAITQARNSTNDKRSNALAVRASNEADLALALTREADSRY